MIAGTVSAVNEWAQANRTAAQRAAWDGLSDGDRTAVLNQVIQALNDATTWVTGADLTSAVPQAALAAFCIIAAGADFISDQDQQDLGIRQLGSMAFTGSGFRRRVPSICVDMLVPDYATYVDTGSGPYMVVPS